MNNCVPFPAPNYLLPSGHPAHLVLQARDYDPAASVALALNSINKRGTTVGDRRGALGRAGHGRLRLRGGAADDDEEPDVPRVGISSLMNAGEMGAWGVGVPAALTAVAAGTGGTAVPIIAAGLAGMRLVRYLTGKGRPPKKRRGGAFPSIKRGRHTFYDDTGATEATRSASMPNLFNEAATRWLSKGKRTREEQSTAHGIPDLPPTLAERMAATAQSLQLKAQRALGRAKIRGLKTRLTAEDAAAMKVLAAKTAADIKAVEHKAGQPPPGLLRALDQRAGAAVMNTATDRRIADAVDWMQKHPTKTGLALLAATTAAASGYGAYRYFTKKKESREPYYKRYY